jgi:hypothetical protein
MNQDQTVLYELTVYTKIAPFLTSHEEPSRKRSGGGRMVRHSIKNRIYS